jgi:hypothetical protein
MEEWLKDLYPREAMKQAGLPWAAQRTRFTSPQLEEAIAKRLKVPAAHREIFWTRRERRSSQTRSLSY